MINKKIPLGKKKRAELLQMIRKDKKALAQEHEKVILARKSLATQQKNFLQLKKEWEKKKLKEEKKIKEELEKKRNTLKEKEKKVKALKIAEKKDYEKKLTSFKKEIENFKKKWNSEIKNKDDKILILTKDLKSSATKIKKLDNKISVYKKKIRSYERYFKRKYDGDWKIVSDPDILIPSSWKRMNLETKNFELFHIPENYNAFDVKEIEKIEGSFFEVHNDGIKVPLDLAEKIKNSLKEKEKEEKKRKLEREKFLLLDIPKTAKNIYKVICKHKELTKKQVKDFSNTSLATVYNVLKILKREDLIVEDEYGIIKPR